jgi:hypothetical protein
LIGILCELIPRSSAEEERMDRGREYMSRSPISPGSPLSNKKVTWKDPVEAANTVS